MYHPTGLLAFVALFAACQEADSQSGTPAEPAAADSESLVPSSPGAEAEPGSESGTESGSQSEPGADFPDSIYGSRNWTAAVAEINGERRLRVSGEIDLPTPGYEVSWKLGPMDRALPPGQRIELILTKPSGIVPQVVTPTPVTIDTPATVPAYREILLHVGGQALETIPLN